ncbi:MAG: AAA family ATPase, partial [Clostridia bacterium]|nr:AAA family ATPase [Clostridia bacterium]
MNTLFIREVKILWNKVDKYSYLRHIAALNRIERVEFNAPVTFFVGENGSGKSTLLEAIAVAYGFNPEGGTKNYNFSTYDSHSQLCNAIKLIKGVLRPKRGFFLRAESFYNVATAEEEYCKYASPSDNILPLELHKKSHGESFLTIVKNKFQSNGIYILDEPEAALSPQKQLTLLAEIYRCVKG